MSAARYTNKIRTNSEARVRKVQYRYNDAHNYNPLGATCAIPPDFSILKYTKGDCCSTPYIPEIIIPYLDGGNAFTNTYDSAQIPEFLDFNYIFQDAYSSSYTRYDGGRSTNVFPDVFSAGLSTDQFPDILYSIPELASDIFLNSGTLGTYILPNYQGGNSNSNFSVRLDGGNSMDL